MSQQSIVLFNPCTEREKRPSQWAPLSLLALGSVLDERGYNVVIMDEKMEEDATKNVLDIAPEALFLGITSMTGPQIRNGIHIAKKVREVHSKLPIIWGGWHPTLCSDSTIASLNVDVVVRGQGQETIIEVAERLKAYQTLEGVLGVSYKENGHIVHNPPRPFKDPNHFKRLAYHLLDLKKYQSAQPRDVGPKNLPSFFGQAKGINYIASYGCPYKCAFCSLYNVYHQRYYPLSPSRVVEDLEYLVNEGFNLITFEDNLFFMNQSWVGEICEGIIERQLDLKWYAAGRAPDLTRFGENLLDSIRRSGCLYVLIGAESGSQDVLELIDKKAKPSDTEKAVDRLAQHGITACLTYMVGVPGESQESHWETFEQMGRIKAHHENTSVTLCVYTPYPGTLLFDRALASGFQEPTTMESWSKISHSTSQLPSLSSKSLHRIRIFKNFYLRYAYPTSSLKKRMRSSVTFFVLHRLTLMRLKRRWLSFQWEFWIFRLRKSLLSAFGRLLTRH